MAFFTQKGGENPKFGARQTPGAGWTPTVLHPPASEPLFQGQGSKGRLAKVKIRLKMKIIDEFQVKFRLFALVR